MLVLKEGMENMNQIWNMVNTRNLVLSEKAFNNQKQVSWIESIRMYFLSTDLYASLRQSNLHGEFLSEK